MPFVNVPGCKCKSYNEHFRQFPRLHSKMGRMDFKITGAPLVSHKCLDLLIPASQATMLRDLYTQIGPFELSMMYQHIVLKDKPMVALNQVALDKMIYRQDRASIDKLHFANRVMHAFSLDSHGARIPGRYLVAVPRGNYSFMWVSADAFGRKKHDEICIDCKRTTSQPITLRCLVPAIANWDSLAPLDASVDLADHYQFAECAPLVVGNERRLLKPIDLVFKTSTVGRVAIVSGESTILATWTGTGAPTSPGTISISSDSSLVLEVPVDRSTSEVIPATSSVVSTVGAMPSTSADKPSTTVPATIPSAMSSGSSRGPSSVTTVAGNERSAEVFASPVASTSARPKTSKVLTTSYVNVSTPVIHSAAPAVSAAPLASAASSSPMSISIDASKVASLPIKSPVVSASASAMQVDTSVGSSVAPMSISKDTSIPKVKSPGAPSTAQIEMCTIWSEESIGFDLPELLELATADVVTTLVEKVVDEQSVDVDVSRSGEGLTSEMAAQQESDQDGSGHAGSGGPIDVASTAAGDAGAGSRAIGFDDKVVATPIPARVVNPRPSVASIMSGPSSLGAALEQPKRAESIDTAELMAMWGDPQSSPSGDLWDHCTLAPPEFMNEAYDFYAQSRFDPLAQSQQQPHE